MSTYFIAQIRIRDPETYEKYLAGFDEIFAGYDAEVVAVDDNPERLEGNWTYTRLVLIRFRDYDEARRWYDSPRYQELVRYRHAASEADIILAEIEGRAPYEVDHQQLTPNLFVDRIMAPNASFRAKVDQENPNELILEWV